MEGCKILPLAKRMLYEGDDRLSFSLSHRLGGFAILTVSPDRPEGAQLAIDPDDRVVEFIGIPAVDQRGAHHPGFASLPRQRMSPLDVIDTLSWPARIADLQLAQVHQPEAIGGKGLLDRGPGIVADGARPFAPEQRAHLTLAHIGIVPAIGSNHDREFVERQRMGWIIPIAQDFIRGITGPFGISLPIEGERLPPVGIALPGGEREHQRMIGDDHMHVGGKALSVGCRPPLAVA